MTRRPARASGPVVPHQPTAGQRWIARAVVLAIRACAATQRGRLIASPEVRDLINERPAIFALWHNRLAFSPLIHRRFIRRRAPNRRLAALVSASRDGALLSAILEGFGVQPVRGSSSRRGPQALLELASWAERGYDLAITPDGPRGPRCEAQMGAVALARVTGLPLIPSASNARWKIELSSWDRFQVPLPFGGFTVVFGKPLQVPPDDDPPLTHWLAELQRGMEAASGSDWRSQV